MTRRTVRVKMQGIRLLVLTESLFQAYNTVAKLAGFQRHTNTTAQCLLFERYRTSAKAGSPELQAKELDKAQETAFFPRKQRPVQ